MKTKLFVLASILIAVNLVSAQEIKTVKIGTYSLSDFTLTSGEGAMTSGLDTRLDFSNEKETQISLLVNNDRATINIGKKFGNWQILGSIGSFKNVPWGGIMLLYQAGSFDAIAWNGAGFSKNETMTAPGYNPNFFISYEGVGVTFWRNNHIGGSLMYFAADPMNWFVAYKRDFHISLKSKIFAEVTYNHDLNIPMFVIGYSMKLK
ncbi:MAG: hypothetical protein WC606_02520 [Candidatus Absconditabacterales bacterium]|jgi:hypothetical protein